MTEKTILITGGTGLVGSHLAGQFAARGHNVLVMSRNSQFSVPNAIAEADRARVELTAGSDVDDTKVLEELIDRADVVFHQAAAIGATGAVENTRDYIENNVSGTASLVDVLRSKKHKIEHVVLSSSISVYGEGVYTCEKCGHVRPHLRYKMDPEGSWDPRCPKCNGPIKPGNTPEDEERRGESIYAVTKKAQEDLLIGTCRTLGVDLTIFRLSTVLGAGQSWHNPFTRFLEMLLQNEQPVLHEDGRQSRDFVFVKDVVAANLAVLDKHAHELSVYNVGSGHAVSLYDFASQLSRKMATALNVEPLAPLIDGKFLAGDVRHCYTDCSKMKDELQIGSATRLHEGLDELVSWFVKKKSAALGIKKA